MKRLASSLALVAIAAACACPALAQTPAAPAGASVPAPAPRAGQAVEGVVALVNDQVISQSDVRNRMRLILLGFSGQTNEEILREAQSHATESLIEEKIQLQEFHELLKDAKVEPEEIDQRIAQLAAQNNMPPEQFTNNLVSQGINLSTLRAQLEADIAWNTLIGARYGRQVRVSELRIDEMINRLTDSLGKPQYRLAEVFLYAPDPASRANAMARAVTLKEEIEKGAPFETVAQQFSAAPSASAGGDLGWIPASDVRPEVMAAMANASPPAVLPPIESEGGVYLMAYLGKREPAAAQATIMDIKQLIVRGEGAAEKIADIRAKGSTCADVVKAAAGVEGAAINDMADVALAQVAEANRAKLEPLEAGQASDPIDIPDGKMALYVCKRATGNDQLPTRKEVRDRLFDTEISMLADRYLRDLKREATIIRR